MLTPGIAAQGREPLKCLIRKLTAFDNCRGENGSYVQHVFDAFDLGDQQVFFKIDYNTEMNAHFPDPTDPAVTRMALTLMLANQY